MALNPGMMIGPSINGGDFKEAEYMKTLMMGKYTMIGRMQKALVDVRDVVEAHLQAILKS